MIAAKRAYEGDHELTRRWSSEVGKIGVSWQQQHAIEIRARLHRLSVDGWDELLQQKIHKNQVKGESQATRTGRWQSVVQFERMLRFVADNYAERITVARVARAADISRNHANTIFRRMLGRTIKEHVMELRLQHARMLLSRTDSKTLTIALNSGFGSLSAFYEAFQSHFGISPAAFRKGHQSGAGHNNEIVP